LNDETKRWRLDVLISKHDHQHNIVEQLIAEGCSDDIVSKAKKEKLLLKDEIRKLELELGE